MAEVLEMAVDEAFPKLARQLFGDVRLEFADEPLERRRLRSVQFGGCRVSELQAGSHSVVGERVARASHDPDSLKLLIQTKGSSLIRQSGRTVMFGEGMPVLYDPTRPYALVNRTPVHLVMLQLPRDAFPEHVLSTLAAPIVPRHDLAGLWHVLLATLRSSLIEAVSLDALGRQKLGAALVHMVRPLLEDSVSGEQVRPASLDILLKRCKLFINAELHSPDLGMERIASRMGCSPRYVFRAFETEDMTPMQYIWEARLRRARQNLSSPAHAGHSITEIAFSLGFSSSAHFSRAFRERFGMPPRDFRCAATLTS
jgi:AraC family transcriptional activator of tynA and feaB